MSVATLLGARGSGRESFTDDEEPRRPFGRRVATRDVALDSAIGIAAARSVDVAVPDLRRRIGPIPTEEPARLPWAIAGLVIASLSAALWFGAYEVVSFLARLLPGIF